MEKLPSPRGLPRSTKQGLVLECLRAESSIHSAPDSQSIYPIFSAYRSWTLVSPRAASLKIRDVPSGGVIFMINDLVGETFLIDRRCLSNQKSANFWPNFCILFLELYSKGAYSPHSSWSS
uniref:FERM domain-containing protein n=1 Tax=Steinernema glaseri TaxID=37863 RepID=A0A1I7YCI4_9BILA